jgi:hypothetical protein
MGPPPTRMELQMFNAYAPGTSLPSGSTPAALYSQGYTQHAWSMGALAHGGMFGVPDWDGSSVSLSELEGGGAGPVIIGPSQTYDAPPPQPQDDPFTPAPPPPHPPHAPDALTYSEGHIRRRPRTRGKDQESARTGTSGVDTRDSVDSVYLNCFLSYYFIFNGLMYRIILIFGFYVAKCYRLTIFIRV